MCLCVSLHDIPLGTWKDRFCTMSLMLLSAINKLHVFNKLMSDWPGATGRCVLSDISWRRALVTGRVGGVVERGSKREGEKETQRLTVSGDSGKVKSLSVWQDLPIWVPSVFPWNGTGSSSQWEIADVRELTHVQLMKGGRRLVSDWALKIRKRKSGAFLISISNKFSVLRIWIVLIWAFRVSTF